MNRFTLRLLLGLVGLVLIPASSYAQTQSSDQSMKELINEVRLLREEVRRLTSGAYRAQAMLERLKLQQEQVNRLNHDWMAVRNELSGIRGGRAEVKEKIVATQERIAAGTAPNGDINGLKAMLSDLDQREQDLILKESQLSGQLNLERTTMEELQKKLDAIDIELQSISSDEKRPKEKP
jgi:chromosome segregation ATPase